MTGNSLPKIVAISGTNASGKSDVGIKLAQRYNGEIISADSRQVYRDFDLCSGKVTREEREMAPHHLIDVREVGEPFSVAGFQAEAYELIPQILQRRKLPLIVGGTGLYVSAVVHGYNLREERLDPRLREELEGLTVEELWERMPPAGRDYLSANESDAQNKRRLIRVLEKLHSGLPLQPQNEPRYNALQLGVTWPKEILDRRIDQRLSDRIEQGMVSEVERYLNGGGNPDHLYALGLEYRYILWYLTGKYSGLEEFYQELSTAIKQFAKRQLTWFRRDKSIRWLDMEGDYMAQACALVDAFLDGSEKA